MSHRAKRSGGNRADKVDSNGMVEALILWESIVNSQCKLKARSRRPSSSNRVHQDFHGEPRAHRLHPPAVFSRAMLIPDPLPEQSRPPRSENPRPKPASQRIFPRLHRQARIVQRRRGILQAEVPLAQSESVPRDLHIRDHRGRHRRPQGRDGCDAGRDCSELVEGYGDPMRSVQAHPREDLRGIREVCV